MLEPYAEPKKERKEKKRILPKKRGKRIKSLDGPIQFAF